MTDEERGELAAAMRQMATMIDWLLERLKC